jgi:hypothetical protein
VIRRVARLIVTALIVGIGISQLVLTVTDWHLSDADAYWNAALRMRTGEALFPVIADPEGSDVYRYSAWFAWVWVPLTYLPRAAVDVLWSAILLVASGLALLPLVHRRAWLAVAFFVPILVGISAIGNVHPLIIAALVLGVERRSGPLWIALASSLKAFPILFALTYAGRREWGRLALTLLLAAALVLPTLLYDVSNYPGGSGVAGMLITWPPVYVLVIGAAILAAIGLANHRTSWLASATIVALSLPRFFVYDVSYVMVGMAGPRESGGRHD